MVSARAAAVVEALGVDRGGERLAELQVAQDHLGDAHDDPRAAGAAEDEDGPPSA